MMPIILPTLVLALLATVAIAGTSRSRRPQDNVSNSISPKLNEHPNAKTLATGSDNDIPGTPPFDVSAQTQTQTSSALTFAFRKTIGAFVLDVAWTTSAKRLAILGASGSGKSMTLRMLAGLETGDTASMTFGDADYLNKPAEERHIAYVPQDYGLFPHLKVAQQWTFARNANAQAAHHWSRHLGLNGLENRYPDSLSLGQRQRVSIVRALSRPCPLILLDEPFSALDTPRRRQLRASLRILQSQISATTIVVTHDPDEAALLADDVLIIDHGKVLQAGPTLTVFRRPASLRVAELLGLSNVGEGYLRHDGFLQIGLDAVHGEPILLKPSSWQRHSAATNPIPGNPSDLPPDGPVLWRVDPSAVRQVQTMGPGHVPAQFPAQALPQVQGGDQRQTGTTGTNRHLNPYHPAIVTGHRLIDGMDYLTVSLGAVTLSIREGRHRHDRPTLGETVHIDIDPAGVDVWCRAPDQLNVANV
jgi:molybdate transport system permease protein